MFIGLNYTMSNALKDSLFLLVKSLKRSEKRHFRLYVKRNNVNSTPLYLDLFNFLDKQVGYNEASILKHVTGLKKSQLANVKSSLYKHLLSALRLLHRGVDAGQAIREQVDFANILYGKSLYRQSLQVLDKAKKKALDLEMRSLAIEIINFEKLIESQYITRSIETRAEDLSLSSDLLITQLHREHKFSNLSLQLYGLYLQMGYARTQDDVQHVVQFYKKHVPLYEESNLKFYERLYLYQSNVWVYKMTHNFAKHYRYAQKWVELFDSNPSLLANNIPVYLKGIHNLLYSQFRGLKRRQFSKTFNRLQYFNSEGEYKLDDNEETIHQLFLNIHRINKHFIEADFTGALKWIGDLESVLETNVYNWDIHRVMVFYYGIACIYFGSGNNEKAIEYLNKIINNPERDFRQDIQSFARVLSLIAHFELGNDVLVDYQLKSVYRFLLKQKELNKVHREILSFLRRTPNMNRYKIKNEFNKLLIVLKDFESSPFERRSFLYLDIISWLESKIENVSFEKVMKRKLSMKGK